jgi:hypothetical protein
MKQPLRTLLPYVVAIVVLAAPVANAVAAEPTVSRQDRQGPVTVTATLLPPATADGPPLRVKVVLDTHSVNLDDLAFESIVALRVPDGSDVEPIAIEQAKGGGHHREAVVVFPAPGAGGGPRIVVKNVGGVRERIFTWDLPASW